MCYINLFVIPANYYFQGLKLFMKIGKRKYFHCQVYNTCLLVATEIK
jgi:hypothetical protein